MKKSWFFLFVFLFILPLSSQAKTELSTRDEVFTFLKGAFQAQVALSEQPRTKKEIEDLLNPYFSKSYQKVFWKGNIVKENGRYLTYGSDFAQYYIPYYQFSKNTKVNIGSEKIYIYEFFPASMEGPVGYKSHYEGLLIRKVKSEWKVDKYLYNSIPKSILMKKTIKTTRRINSVSYGNIRPLFY